MRVIERERLPFHPRLGRNVNHDSASRAYRVQPRRTVALKSVRHESHIPVLDQGSLGSCTGNAGVAAIYRAPYVAGVVKPWSFPATEDGAVALYSQASKVDAFRGEYPPDDTGSDGLSIAKVLKSAGIVSGYRWAFTLQEALEALMETPLITGIPWLNSMFDAPSNGILTVNQTSGLAGGHEIAVDEYIAADDPRTSAGALVGGPNSWGPSWGDHGRWYMRVQDWAGLLAQDGDVTQFVPLSQPAPVPVEPASTDPAGDRLWNAAKAWAHAPHTGSNRAAAQAVKDWATETGRS
jgi:hypothetical protein